MVHVFAHKSIPKCQNVRAFKTTSLENGHNFRLTQTKTFKEWCHPRNFVEFCENSFCRKLIVNRKLNQ